MRNNHYQIWLHYTPWFKAQKNLKLLLTNMEKNFICIKAACPSLRGPVAIYSKRATAPVDCLHTYFYIFITRCEMFRVDLNGSIFQLTLWGWNIKIIGTLRVDRHQAPCLSGASLYMVIYWLSTPLYLHIFSPVAKYSTSNKLVRFFS